MQKLTKQTIKDIESITNGLLGARILQAHAKQGGNTEDMMQALKWEHREMVRLYNDYGIKLAHYDNTK